MSVQLSKNVRKLSFYVSSNNFFALKPHFFGLNKCAAVAC